MCVYIPRETTVFRENADLQTDCAALKYLQNQFLSI